MAAEIINSLKAVVPRAAVESKSGGPEQTSGTAKVRSGQPIQESPEPKREQEVSQAEFEQAVVKLQDAVQIVKRSLEFHVDENSGRVIVTVLDSDTGETVRQIPREEVMALADQLQEESTSKLINVTV